MARRAAAALLGAAAPAAALDNGLARTPPMGWRSWNAYHQSVTQEMMETVMVKMSERTRKVDGKLTSFADLGYNNCGLDDYWQQCGAGVNKSFHDANGKPLINSKFPDMKKMTDHGHSLGLRVGWYMNNCGCNEHQFVGYDHIKTHMEGSVKALIDYGYDGVKLDGCGQFLNLTWWSDLINKTGKAILIENCHWGGTTPGHPNGDAQAQQVWHQGEWRAASPDAGGPSQGDAPCTGTTPVSDCPYSFFRTSGDIGSSWGSMFRNLQTTTPYQGDPPLSRPGTWAYPDMMEVGKLANAVEDRAHFGAWCVTSSPLIMGHDMADESLNDRIWPIVSNKEAIAVNQAWAGHPGRRVKDWDPPAGPSPAPAPGSEEYIWGVDCDKSPMQSGWKYDSGLKQLKSTDGFCAEVAAKGGGSDGELIALNKCDSSNTAQQFTLTPGEDGYQLIKANNGKCMNIYGAPCLGPVLQLYGCSTSAPNENFNLTSDGTLKSKCGKCLAAKLGVPQQGGGSGSKMQMWAKPLAEGATDVAVLLLNNGGEAYTVTIDLAKDLNIAGKVKVRDIWEQKDAGTATGTFTTDSFGSHDSRFYRFTA